jgi:hypothetical protein
MLANLARFRPGYRRVNNAALTTSGNAKIDQALSIFAPDLETAVRVFRTSLSIVATVSRMKGCSVSASK